MIFRLLTFTVLTITLGSVAMLPAPTFAQKKKEKPKWPPIQPNVAALERTLEGLDGPGQAIAASDNGTIAVACDKSTIQLFGRDALKGIRGAGRASMVLRGHTGSVTALGWNGGPILASAGIDKRILLWDVAKGKLKAELKTDVFVRALVMSDDGKSLASAGDGPDVRLWDVASAKPTKKLSGHKDWITALAFAPNGKQIASGSYEGKTLLWDVATGNKVREFYDPQGKEKKPPEDVRITSIVFSPDGESLLSGRSDGLAELFQVKNGKRVRTFQGHDSSVTALKFHPLGDVVVSASKDGTIGVWNAGNGRPYKMLPGHKAWVEGIAFLQKATRVASVSADRTVKIWKLAAK